MATSIPALVTATVLEYARTSAGFDIEAAALRLKVSPTRLAEWESGESATTVAKLKQIATLYRRPLAFFYLPSPPNEAAQAEDFRTVSADEPQTHPELTLQVRRLRELREVALRVEHDLGNTVTPPSLSARLDENPSAVAKRFRAWLDVSVLDQMRWRNGSEALREWRARLEERGVLVFQYTRVPVRTARGFSIFEDRLPVIALNSADPAEARCFTLLHELTHLALHKDGICDLASVGRSSKIERFCNLVAAETLVPADALKGLVGTNSPPDIAELAKRLKVSREAMALRLIAIGRLAWADYERFRAKHLTEVEDEREQRRLDRDETTRGPQHTTLVVTNLGRRFLRMLVAAYQDGIVTAPEFRDYTSVRVSNLEKLQTAIGVVA
jgi:Zn-dependent peptidase ImmA (M78 family)